MMLLTEWLSFSVGDIPWESKGKIKESKKFETIWKKIKNKKKIQNEGKNCQEWFYQEGPNEDSTNPEEKKHKSKE